MTTVHIILNAHLDPVWLWSWREGLDEVLNTGYYICNLLDRHPDIIYTRGESWVYEQIRKVDPALFARIKAHVEAGRWEVVGGWFIQPDCNQPSGFAMERQISLGQEWFTEAFGSSPKIAYNVDSFGHAATLPGLIRKAGQSAYVMMRPQEHEMTLPGRVFRWRGYADGPEVTTFRIAAAYCTPEGINEKHIRASLEGLPEGVAHTMCFVGIGDHGGGPTDEIIEWCRTHREAFPGIRIEFSSPQRFFKAIEADTEKLPLVVGELQQHAIGCYSVYRAVKTGLRTAEHRLMQAEITGSSAEELRGAWERVCFNHFHDTLGGTCLPSAYQDVNAELGAALAMADEAATIALRRRLVTLPDDTAQRTAFFNASEEAFDDFVEVEPWLEWTPWQPNWALVDESGADISFQKISAETHSDTQVRLLFRLQIEAGGLRIVRIVEKSHPPAPVSQPVKTTGDSAESVAGVILGAERAFRFGASRFPVPTLSLSDDLTDTWSHGIDRYGRENMEFAVWEKAALLEEGPLMAALVQHGRIGSSELVAEWRVYQDQPWVELRLRVLWVEKRRLLKLDWELTQMVTSREDGIMGGSLQRSPDGRELPLRDWTLLSTEDDWSAAIVAPDVYAIDGDANRTSLTLLRSCVMACHEPNIGDDPRSVFTDHGSHEFRFRFLVGSGLETASLDRMALHMQRRPLHAEVTRGMKNRAKRGAYQPGRLT